MRIFPVLFPCEQLHLQARLRKEEYESKGMRGSGSSSRNVFNTDAAQSGSFHKWFVMFTFLESVEEREKRDI